MRAKRLFIIMLAPKGSTIIYICMYLYMLKAITARVCGGIHESLHLFKAAIKNALKNVHQIAIKYHLNIE